ncbi:MAG TPA: phage/plasmid primase, P4 family, partial [Clostridia bacterium]|nr:phage/plasmid primase, P4 family [Clostridia bacterium]
FDGIVKFDHDSKKWFIWDENRWTVDTTDRILLYAREIVKVLLKEALSNPIGGDFEEYLHFIRHTDSPAGLKNLLKLAGAYPQIACTATDFDAGELLLGAGPVTIDLEMICSEPAKPEDLITKKIGPEYDPEATCPKFESFMKDVTDGDDDLSRYIQKAVGYSLTGSMEDESFFYLYGPTGTGKTTFLNTIYRLLGDYAAHVDFSTFLTSKNGTIRNDLAALKGTRFITASEPEANDTFSGSTIKSWTGRDPVTARFLFHEFFTFVPTGKVWLSSNHMIAAETDASFWRRIKVVPFKHRLPEDQRGLKEDLLLELPGILNWALRGLYFYWTEGLNPPKAVIDATTEYRRSNDSLEQFIVECCVIEESAVTKNQMLYVQYAEYCRTFTLDCYSQRRFSLELSAKPRIKKIRRSDGAYWQGIGIK